MYNIYELMFESQNNKKVMTTKINRYIKSSLKELIKMHYNLNCNSLKKIKHNCNVCHSPHLFYQFKYGVIQFYIEKNSKLITIQIIFNDFFYQEMIEKEMYLPIYNHLNITVNPFLKIVHSRLHQWFNIKFDDGMYKICFHKFMVDDTKEENLISYKITKIKKDRTAINQLLKIEHISKELENTISLFFTAMDENIKVVHEVFPEYIEYFKSNHEQIGVKNIIKLIAKQHYEEYYKLHERLMLIKMLNI